MAPVQDSMLHVFCQRILYSALVKLIFPSLRLGDRTPALTVPKQSKEKDTAQQTR